MNKDIVSEVTAVKDNSVSLGISDEQFGNHNNFFCKNALPIDFKGAYALQEKISWK